MRYDAVGPLKQVLEDFRKDFLSGLSETDLARPIRLSVRDASEQAPDPAGELREKIVEVLSNE